MLWVRDDSAKAFFHFLRVANTPSLAVSAAANKQQQKQKNNNNNNPPPPKTHTHTVHYHRVMFG